MIVILKLVVHSHTFALYAHSNLQKSIQYGYMFGYYTKPLSHTLQIFVVFITVFYLCILR